MQSVIEHYNKKGKEIIVEGQPVEKQTKTGTYYIIIE